MKIFIIFILIGLVFVFSGLAAKTFTDFMFSNIHKDVVVKKDEPKEDDLFSERELHRMICKVLIRLLQISINTPNGKNYTLSGTLKQFHINSHRMSRTKFIMQFKSIGLRKKRENNQMLKNIYNSQIED